MAPPPGSPLVDFDPDVLPPGVITSAANQGAGGSQYDLIGSATIVDGPNGHQAFEFGGAERLAGPISSPWRFLHSGQTPVHVLALVKAPTANPNALIPILGTSAGQTTNQGMSLWIDDRAAATRNEQVRASLTLSQGGLTTQSADGAVTPLDQWHLIEWTMFWGASVLSAIRVDGAQVAFNSSPVAPSSLTPTNPLQIGDWGADNSPVPAGTRIGRVLMYNTGENVDARAWMLAYAGLA